MLHLIFGFSLGLSYNLNFPYLSDPLLANPDESTQLDKVREFGQLMGYFAGLRQSNPTIRGYYLNLGINRKGQSMIGKNLNSCNILGHYLHSMSPEIASSLTFRLAMGYKLQRDKLSEYPLTNTVARLVTSNCSTVSELIPRGRIGLLIYAFTLYYTREWAR